MEGLPQGRVVSSPNRVVRAVQFVSSRAARVGEEFSKDFVHRRARRDIRKFCDVLGPERIEWAIQHNQHLSKFIPEAQLASWRQQAKQHAWVANAISDDDFRQLMPTWTRELVQRHGDEGAAWLQDFLQWLRGLFTSNESGNGAQDAT